MSEKHLATGSTCPPLAPGALRIYSMKYCPFAQRATMVAAHKKIPHEIVNCDLKQKAEWFFDKNAEGLVPVIEQEGKLVQESAICMDYLDDISPGSSLYPEDPYLKARMRLNMDKAPKLVGAYYKLLRCAEAERAENHKELLKHLTVTEAMVQGDFMGGDSPMMIDFFFYPWFERLCVIKDFFGIDMFETLPKLSAWYARMVALPAVQATFTTPENHVILTKMYASGKVDYDFELK